MVDFNRVQQVLVNLLTNAIKFSHKKGTVTVILVSRQVMPNLFTNTIDVVDNGIGISEEDQQKLFTPFY